MLILSSILDLKTCQIDYTQAFLQAELHDPVFIQIPQGWFIKEGIMQQHDNPRFNDTTHYLRLKRNLYGIKQAAHNWFKHLQDGLLNLGFAQSSMDCCLFLRHNCILILYVDDCLIFAPHSDTIDKLLADLSKTYTLKHEGEVSAYLGVQVRKDETTKTITLTQPGVIEQVIQDVGLLEFSKGKDTPADGISCADKEGPPRCDTWNYRSVIGKLNYISNNTRPDISMTVHQCAHFSSSPRAIHELAVKQIIRYLFAPKTKGLTLHPTTDLTLDMYVDSDFAGMWQKEHAHLQDNILSRTGYVILFGGCPITWASKLQTEIALSMMESEYIALSTATRELLPLRQIMADIDAHSFISLLKQSMSTINYGSLQPSRIYEDNAACIVLATTTTNFKP